MPVVKDQLKRFRIIHDKISAGRYPSKQLLAEICEVSEESIDKDRQKLISDYNAPIKYSRAKGGYYYSDENFVLELDGNVFSEPERKALNLALRQLGQLKDNKEVQDIKDAIENLEKKLLLEDSSTQYIYFQASPKDTGLQYFEEVRKAIYYGEALDIKYFSLNSGKEKAYTISPYALKQYMRRWYVLLHDHDSNDIRSYELGRFRSIEKSKADFKANTEIDIEHYFEYSAGVNVPQGKQVDVEIKVHEKYTEEIINRFRIHPKQGEVINGLLKFKSYITVELLRNIAGFGNQISIIKPQELIESFNKYTK